MEESDAHIDGYFKTHEQALQKAKSIVKRSMSEFYKPKMTADELLDQYSRYGEDPAIFSNNKIKKKFFLHVITQKPLPIKFAKQKGRNDFEETPDHLKLLNK